MAERISVEEIKSKNPIQDVIGRYVKLTRKHGLLQGLCCFHDEDSPSLTAYEDSQRYYCYGCSASGDVISFIQQARNISFKEAIELLGGESLANIPIPPPAPRPPPEPLPVEFEKGHTSLFEMQKTMEFYAAGAKSLGLTPESFMAIKAAWSEKQQAWMFPLYDETGLLIGIRFRNTRGDKWSLKGGRSGLFVPSKLFLPRMEPIKVLWITEGPTDLAALISIGLNEAIGRPSASSGDELVVKLVAKLQPKNIIVIADNDQQTNKQTGEIHSVGLESAQRLAAKINAKVLRLPEGIKDARDFVKAGGNVDKLRELFKTQNAI